MTDQIRRMEIQVYNFKLFLNRLDLAEQVGVRTNGDSAAGWREFRSAYVRMYLDLAGQYVGMWNEYVAFRNQYRQVYLLINGVEPLIPPVRPLNLEVFNDLGTLRP